MDLRIFSPEKLFYEGKAVSVSVPGMKDGPFVILENHAPLIAVLTEGKVSYNTGTSEVNIEISGGFVEVRNNEISLCVEIIKEK